MPPRQPTSWAGNSIHSGVETRFRIAHHLWHAAVDLAHHVKHQSSSRANGAPTDDHLHLFSGPIRCLVPAEQVNQTTSTFPLATRHLRQLSRIPFTITATSKRFGSFSPSRSTSQSSRGSLPHPPCRLARFAAPVLPELIVCPPSARRQKQASMAAHNDAAMG
jgi:hypothetical protein